MKNNSIVDEIKKVLKEGKRQKAEFVKPVSKLSKFPKNLRKLCKKDFLPEKYNPNKHFMFSTDLVLKSDYEIMGIEKGNALRIIIDKKTIYEKRIMFRNSKIKVHCVWWHMRNSEVEREPSPFGWVILDVSSEGIKKCFVEKREKIRESINNKFTENYHKIIEENVVNFVHENRHEFDSSLDSKAKEIVIAVISWIFNKISIPIIIVIAGTLLATWLLTNQ